MTIETISSGVGTPSGAADTSFAAFVESVEGQNACGKELADRLKPSAGTITTRNTLLQFAKERWPDQYGPQDWRQPPSIANAPFGSLRMKQIWAAFLRWKEAL